MPRPPCRSSNLATAASSSASRKKVRQACDSCHARKTRCDGCVPCANCRTARAACTYLAVHHKTGPKGPRRRRTAPALPRQPAATTTTTTTSLRPPVAPVLEPRPSPPQSSPCNSPVREEAHLVPDSAPLGNNEPPPGQDQSFQPSPELPDHIINWCLDAFFRHKHPITPILHQASIYQHLDGAPKPPDIYSLLASCCSVISLSPAILSPTPASDDVSSSSASWTLPSTDFLLAETLRARRCCHLAESPSLTHAQTSFFLFSTFFCLGKDNAAWYYLREAITLLQTLRLHEEATYAHVSDPVQATYSRRMFWVLYITERAYALQRHRPLTLRNTLALPTAFDPPVDDPDVLPGFLDLISLFRHFDTDFIETWNSATPSHAHVVPPAASTSSKAEPMLRLQEVLKRALPSVVGYSEMQQADLLISRQWLKVMVWQLCVTRTLLSNGAGEESMSLQYPVTIARDALLVSHLLPVKALEANGVGILEKLFDIGCSLADIMALPSSAGRRASAMDTSPVDTLFGILKILATTLGGSYRHLDVLSAKVSQCLLLDVPLGFPLQIEGGEEEAWVEEIGEGE